MNAQTDNGNADQAHTDTQDRQFAIQKVYVKDISFESPQTPAVFSEASQPEVDMQLGTQASPAADGQYEVVLSVTVTARENEATIYLAEVQQAGLFALGGFDNDQLGQMLGSFCPSILYPFARQAIAELVSKGGFPQVLLAPVNFDALYAQHLEEQRQAQQQPGTDGNAS